MTNKKEIIGKEPYAVSEHQQFTDRTGQLVRVIRGSPMPVPVGEAYAFFDCNATKQEIEREIPTIRNLSQTPNELELYLMNGPDIIDGNVELRRIAHEARDADLKYMIKANYPTGTNRQTADQLSGILNQAYQSHLYQKDEPFRGEIVYKEKGKYVSRD